MPAALALWIEHFDFLAVMLAALVLHNYLPVPASLDPFTLLAGMADNLQSKVNPSRQRPVPQQKLSGVLAALLLILPFLVLLQLLLLFSEYPAAFELILLWLSLGWQRVRKDALVLEQQLNRDYKLQARERIQRMVLRDTDRLSPLGIAKAGVEAVLQRGYALYFAVLFWYVIGGAVTAVGYRALRTLVDRWNPKLPRFVHFGSRPANCLRWLDAIPVRMVSLVFAISGSFVSWTRRLTSVNSRFPANNAGALLEGGAAALQIKLSGPVIYAGERHERIRVNANGREPRAQDLRHATTLIQRAITLWVGVLIFFSICFAALISL